MATYSVENRALIKGLIRKDLDGNFCVLIEVLTERQTTKKLIQLRQSNWTRPSYKPRGLPLKHPVQYLCTDSIIIGIMPVKNTLTMMIMMMMMMMMIIIIIIIIIIMRMDVKLGR